MTNTEPLVKLLTWRRRHRRQDAAAEVLFLHLAESAASNHKGATSCWCDAAELRILDEMNTIMQTQSFAPGVKTINSRRHMVKRITLRFLLLRVTLTLPSEVHLLVTKIGVYCTLEPDSGNVSTCAPQDKDIVDQKEHVDKEFDPQGFCENNMTCLTGTARNASDLVEAGVGGFA